MVSLGETYSTPNLSNENILPAERQPMKPAQKIGQ
jgi:hypothetical protein